MEFENIKDEIPINSPVQPVQLSENATFRFSCFPGISCFNACCKNIDITLTPYDIVRLRACLAVESREFVGRYTVPFEMDHHGLPGLKLMTKPATKECVFLGESGCTVYEDRPVSCRYYALGSMGVKATDAGEVEDRYFLVKEPHCKGHEQAQMQTVAEYRDCQGAAVYDEMNREWRDVIIKKRSSGPTVGKPSERSMQLFDMCSYDTDSFIEFVLTDGFQAMFDVARAYVEQLESDDDERLRFAFRFLKQVLFGENTIPVRAGAPQSRLKDRGPILHKRQRDAIQAHQQQQADLHKDSTG